MGTPSFADVFDDALRRARNAPVAAFPTAAPVAAADPCLFPRPLAAVPPQWTRAYPQAPHPPHRLSGRQRQAFERLTALGASLPANFTAEALRREYRQLARRLHPDSQSGAAGLSAAERSRAFMDATESYRCLRLLVEFRH